MSNGPYSFESITNNVAYLKNSTIYTPEYYVNFKSTPFMKYPVIRNVTIVKIDQSDIALTSLKNGEIDIIDYNTNLGSLVDQITIGGNAKYMKYSSPY